MTQIETPREFTDLRQVYAYLYRMADSLNAAAEAVSAQTDRQIGQALAAGSAGSSAKLEKAAASLRSLILDTAETVRLEMNTVEQVLNSDLQAVSARFGEYRETAESRMTATAKDVITSYRYSERITALDGALESLGADLAALQDYRTGTEGYIRQGIMEIGGRTTVGIAVGLDLQGYYNGAGEYVVDRSRPCAFYTPEKVSFMLGGEEAASFSNSGLKCGSAELGGRLTLSGNWEIKSSSHLTVRWMG